MITIRAAGRRRGPLALGLATLLVAGATTSCSSSGGAKKPSSAPGSSPVSAPGSSAAGKPADAATSKAVSTAFGRFFDSHTTPTTSEKYLQHGSAFLSVLQAQAKGSYARNSSASVSKVSLVSANLASVTFTLSSNGASLLKDIPGYAVREGGAWKVSATSFCGLIKLEGTSAPACGQAANTTLPK